MTLPMQSSRPTLKQVAARANCSLGAVSAILNNATCNIRVSPLTADRIHAAADSLGYVPSYHARTLHLKRSFTLGLVLGDAAHRMLSVGYWSKLVSSVDAAARERGYDLLFIGPSGGKNEVERAVLSVRQGRVDALICTDSLYLEGEQKLLNDLRHPVVFLRDRSRTPHPSILLDEVPAIGSLLKALIKHGHRSFTYVTAERKEHKFWSERLELIRSRAQSDGLEMKILYVDESVSTRHHPHTDLIVQAAYSDVSHALRGSKTIPTAMVFYNDAFALGGLQAVKDVGYKIPDDISLIGFDNLRSGLCIPKLAEVNLELEKAGQRAVEIALEMAGEPAAFKRYRRYREYIPMQFIAHDSLGKARKS